MNVSAASPSGQPSENARAPLARKTIFFYGLTQMPLAMLIVPLAIFLPNFYSRDLGLALTLYADIILLVGVFDIATDLLIGSLSDRTRSRFGRRRPWIVAGTPLLMAGLYMLFLPSGAVDGWYLFTWTMVLRLGWTMIMIPYYAWGAELSPDYHERSTITGWRAVVAMFTYLLIQGMLVIALAFFDYGGVANNVRLIGIAMMVILPLAVFLTATQVSEKRDFVPSVMPLAKGLRLMWRNGPFKRLVFAFLMGNLGMAVMLQTFIFFVRDVLVEERAYVYVLLLMYVVTMFAVPFWVWLSHRMGKHRSWIISFAVWSVASIFYLLLGEGDLWWMLPISIVAGFASGAYESMANSMKADVIDIDTIRGRRDRAAWFFSVWSFVTKAAGTIATWGALRGLAMAGYVPELGMENSEQGLLALRLTFAIVPAIFFVLAILVTWRYPLTEARHAKIRTVLERRRARASASSAGE